MNGTALQQTGNQVAASARGPIQKFSDKIASLEVQNFLLTTLGAKKDSFVNNITSLVSNDAKLQACAPMTLIYAGIKATALGLPLDPNLGFAYVIPYENKRSGITEAQLQMGYRGFIQLAERSGEYHRINVGKVYEGEISNIDKLSGDIELKGTKTSDKVVGYFAYFRLRNGFEKVKYMTIEEMEAHAKRYSQTYGSAYDKTRNSSKWATDFDAMAEKTVLKLLLSKFGPLSVEMRDAIRSDQAVLDQDGNVKEYVDAPDEQEQRISAVEEKKEAMRSRLIEETGDMPIFQ